MGEIADSLRQREEIDRNFRIKTAVDMNYDPERADRIFAVSAKTKLPEEIVDADLEGLESMLKRQEFNIDSYRDSVNGSPVFNRFAAENPYHPTVLERDRKSLTRLERALEPIFQSWDAGWATTEIAEIQDRQLAGNTQPSDEEDLKRLRSLVSGGHFGVDNKFAKFLTGTAKQLPIQLWIVKESAEEIMVGGMAGGSIGLAGGFGIGAVPGFFGGMGAGYFAGRTGAAFKLERGLAIDEFKELGLDADDSVVMANSIGAVNAALESIGLGAITKRLPGFREIQRDATGEVISRVFKDRTFKAAAGRLTAAYGETVATEVITEVLQESTLYAGREYLKSNARLSGDVRPETRAAVPGEFWGMVKDTAVETLYGTALIAGAGPVSQFYRESQQAYQAERLAEAWKSVGKAAKESVTREKSPSKYEEFVKRLTENGKNDTVRIDAQEFVTFFQEQGIDSDEVAAKLGIDKATLEEELNFGHDITIGVEAYLRHIAPTEYHEGLLGSLKTGDMEMSLKEAELFRKNNPELSKKLEAMVVESAGLEVDTEIESIVQDVLGQLVAANMDQASAGQLAQIMRGIGVMARRQGMDPVPLYEQVFAGVKRVSAKQEQTRENIDILVDPLLDRLRAGEMVSERDMFGPSLIEFINDKGGVNPTDPELEAMDFELGAKGLGVSQAKLNRWKKGGKSLAEIAEIAAEAGYIVGKDENQLIEALRRELSGERTISTLQSGGTGAQDLNAKLQELSDIINEAGIEMEGMTNEEVRAALAKRQTLNQVDTKDLQDLTQMVLSQLNLEERMRVTEKPFGPGDVDRTLARTASILPLVSDKQDFGDLTISDTVRIEETGKRAKVKLSVQSQFDEAVERKNVIKRLLDCLSG